MEESTLEDTGLDEDIGNQRIFRKRLCPKKNLEEPDQKIGTSSSSDHKRVKKIGTAVFSPQNFASDPLTLARR